jgi:hypothetical protein
MEITIKIDGNDAGGAGAVQPAVASQEAASEAAPPAAVAAAAQATGAINAGPARIPAGQTGQPLADIASTTQPQLVGGGGDPGLAAGAAPGFAEEPPAMVVEDGDGEEPDAD